VCVPVHTVSMAMADGPPLHLHLHDGIQMSRFGARWEGRRDRRARHQLQLQLAKGLARLANANGWQQCSTSLGKERKGCGVVWCGGETGLCFIWLASSACASVPCLPPSEQAEVSRLGALSTLGNSSEDPCLPDRVIPCPSCASCSCGRRSCSWLGNVRQANERHIYL
jgi:hypothetical protein